LKAHESCWTDGAWFCKSLVASLKPENTKGTKVSQRARRLWGVRWSMHAALQSAKRKILARQKKGAQDDNSKWFCRSRLNQRLTRNTPNALFLAHWKPRPALRMTIRNGSACFVQIADELTQLPSESCWTSGAREFKFVGFSCGHTAPKN
jgi:hypothetical protein